MEFAASVLITATIFGIGLEYSPLGPSSNIQVASDSTSGQITESPTISQNQGYTPIQVGLPQRREGGGTR